MPPTPEKAFADYTQHEQKDILDYGKVYGLDADQALISFERRKHYGDPWINHYGIAQSWTGLIQPWAARIARMEPLPPHVVALMMTALKTNRTRMTFHDDNYVDAGVYSAFARKWQEDWFNDITNERPMVIPQKPHPDAQLVVRWEIPGESAKPAIAHPVPPIDRGGFSQVTQHNGPAGQFSIDWRVPEGTIYPVSLVIGATVYKVVPL